MSAPRLIDRVPAGAALVDPGAILDRFLAWVADTGLTPYDHQDEALLEISSGRHVVLATPTGSGKSLVALGLHFKAMCEGKRSFYTAPIKALVNEKFFDLCEVFGAENVGMLTGDAAINWAAPIVCCTQEVLANMALRQGKDCDAPYVVMDEFHYYADRDRGHAWQVPLLVFEKTTFLLMSATLGNTALIEEQLGDLTQREVAHVWSTERPVPLDFDYRDSALQETVEDLLEEGRAPVYVVSFTQREAAETAGGLTSARVASKELRRQITEAISDVRFDSPYGREMRRILSHGIGLHHAGLLPKYRRAVEKLSQEGLLRVISGTDTLGVGVNVPIRTVLFTRLSKYDGEKVRVLSVRDFQQIAGRAGRKGFDDRGSIVCQAPEHVIENQRNARKGKAKKKKGPKPPPRGFVGWDKRTFERLTDGMPEILESRFRVTHGMMVQVLQREAKVTGPRGGYGDLAQLIERSHERPRRKHRLLRESATLFRALRTGGVVRIVDRKVEVDEELQRDFSLHQTLSLYLLEALSALDPEEEGHALRVLSCVEAVLEDPVVILRQQVRKLKDALVAELKAKRVPYEDRITKLDEVTAPRPEEEFLQATFRIFAEHHPWVSRESVRPKSIAREMAEGFESFDNYVRRYGIQRNEGTLLRYLGQVGTTIDQTVPDNQKSEEVLEIAAYLRDVVRRTDTSLLQEWETRVAGGPVIREEAPRPKPRRRRLAEDPRALRARARTELHALVRALSQKDWEEAERSVRADLDSPWRAADFENALRPYFAAYPRLRFDPAARQAHLTAFSDVEAGVWHVQQTLLDPDEIDTWCIEVEIDLRVGEPAPEEPLLRVLAIHD
jgi:hypothetical protein